MNLSSTLKQGTLAAAITCGSILLVCGFAIPPLPAQATATPYSRMAPVEQYLMNRDAEIALARSAAPESISRDATVLVLGPHGYETAVAGTNGFVCMVERGWMATFDASIFWNPKIRGADCINAQAARTMLPLARMRAEMALAGYSQQQIAEKIRAALLKNAVPPLAAGAMGYMLSKDSYLTAKGGNLAHLMIFVPRADAAAWGAGLAGSPVASSAYWFNTAKSAQELQGLPPIRIFIVAVPQWSDGSQAASM